MPRMLRRAAVLGATAHVASQRGQARGAAEAQEQAAAQEQYAAPPPPAPAAAAPAPDTYAELMQLKSLLDAGALTQAEFDAQKQKILSA
jgi:hypothetical protein